MSQILTVRELTERVKRVLEGGFPYVWVRGEVTNLARPSSGHLYFSLKDGDALLRSVWFRGSQKEQQAFDPLTGEVFDDGPRPSLARSLRNGQQVICAGRLSVYAPRGDYQLIVELAQDSGEGALFLALEELKRKLAGKGYFSLERKRPLPVHPTRVSVLTAPSGAAIQDFLRLSTQRGVGFQVRIHPVPVQGDEAPPRLVEAIRKENADAWAEVIVLIRGGGSLQDLWAFNDERVADAIYASGIPVLAGIGHEVDTSLADMVADVRAATPSHAAQVLWPERSWYEQRTDDLELTLGAAFARRLGRLDTKLDSLHRALVWFSPVSGLARRQERFNALAARLDNVWLRRMERLDMRLAALTSAVRRSAGLANVRPLCGQVHELTRRLILAENNILASNSERLAAHARKLEESRTNRLSRAELALERLSLRLAAHDPEAPLTRGYAFAMTEDGRFVRGVRDLKPGAALTIKIRDGEADARITAVRPAGE